jgi:hypothetical protein
MFDRKAWAKEYYLKNKDHLLSKNKEWSEANKDSIAERRKAQRSGNKQVAAKKQEWQQRNKEKVAEYNRNWKQNNRDKHNALGMKRHAAKINRTPPWLTKQHFSEMRAMYKQAKDMSLAGAKYEVDHIVPLQGASVSGLHVPWNLQILPMNENRRKWNHLS